MHKGKPFVIVGAGLAGAKAAETLRDEGFEGRITLLGAEPEAPYERPPLSKEYLRGESGREQALVHPRDFYATNDIELRTSVSVSAIEPGERVVVSADGERFAYEKLLLATGSEPRTLPIPGADLEGVHHLRTIADADGLARAIAAAERLVVIGAGWIGSEVAASARERGVAVSVLEQADVPLQHVLGTEVGSIYADIHRAHGTDLRLSVGVEALEGSDAVERVRLRGGDAIDCDLVVIGVGVAPSTGLAEAAGLEVDNGVIANAHLTTSDPRILAAGDVANAYHPFYGRRIRVEHWANAVRQGEAAARAMLRKPATKVRLPYFFSDQFDVGMEYTGLATEWERVVFRGDPAEGQFIAFWIQDGRPVAGMNVNVWDVAEDIEALIRAGRPVDTDLLRDPDVPLARLAGEPEKSPNR